MGNAPRLRDEYVDALARGPHLLAGISRAVAMAEDVELSPDRMRNGQAAQYHLGSNLPPPWQWCASKTFGWDHCIQHCYHCSSKEIGRGLAKNDESHTR